MNKMARAAGGILAILGCIPRTAGHRRFARGKCKIEPKASAGTLAYHDSVKQWHPEVLVPAAATNLRQGASPKAAEARLKARAVVGKPDPGLSKLDELTLVHIWGFASFCRCQLSSPKISVFAR